MAAAFLQRVRLSVDWFGQVPLCPRMYGYALAASPSLPLTMACAVLAAQLRALYRFALALSSARPLLTPRAVRAGGFQSGFLSDQLALRHPRFPGMPNVKFSGPGTGPTTE